MREQHRSGGRVNADAAGLRQATAADAAAIARLLEQLGHPAPTEEIAARLDALARIGSGTWVWVAEQEGRVDGLITTHVTPDRGDGLRVSRSPAPKGPVAASSRTPPPRREAEPRAN